MPDEALFAKQLLLNWNGTDGLEKRKAKGASHLRGRQLPPPYCMDLESIHKKEFSQFLPFDYLVH